MAEKIELSDQTYARLEQLKGTADTSESVIKRLLDAFQSDATEDFSGTVSIPGNDEANAPRRVTQYPYLKKATRVREFFGSDVPNLTHTRIVSADIITNGGRKRKLLSPKWNDLKNRMIKKAISNGVDIEKLWTELGVKGVIQGQKSIHGYTYYEDEGISIQGQSADDAWRTVVKIARYLKVPIHVRCEWKKRDSAALPGEMADLYSERPTRHLVDP